MTTTAAASAQDSRQRKAVVPPAVVTEGMTLFEYLEQCQPPLDRKLIDIACSQSKVPQELRQDAAQEIRIMWTGLTPDTAKYKPGQIASYAHRMACHAALRLRRDLGAAVRLPGSAFRKRRDGSSYVTPGVLAEALDWDSVEQWFELNDSSVDASVAGNLPSQGMGLDIAALSEEPIATPEDDEETLRRNRLEELEACKDALTPRQYELTKMLIEGATYEEAMTQHDLKKGVLMRELAIVGSLVKPMAWL